MFGKMRSVWSLVMVLGLLAALVPSTAAAQSDPPPYAEPLTLTGTPQVGFTVPTTSSPVEGEADESVEVAFTSNRSWSVVVDFRAHSDEGEWRSFADDTGSTTAERGENEVDLKIPLGTAEGEYDLRVRLFNPGNQPMDEAEVEAGLHVTSEDPEPVFGSVEVTPVTVELSVGDSAPLTATAYYDDGSDQDVTGEAEWTSADESIATVDADGTVTAVAEGTTDVTAAYEGEHAIASVTVTVTVPTVFTTDFKEDDQVVGRAPAGWSQLWGEGGFEIADAPRRVVHTATSGSQESIVFDAPGEIDYGMDAEVSGLVRLPVESAPSGTSTRFQMHMQASGESGDHHSFYTDATGASVRLNRYLDGNYITRGGAHSYAVPADTWHHVVMQRHDDVWRTKMWPYGEDEPSSWMIETDRTTIDGRLPAGQPGIGHFAAGAVHEWAWFSVAVGADPSEAQAERAPEDLFEPSPDAEVTGVQIEPSAATIEVDDSVELTASAVYDDGAVQDVTTSADWSSTDPAVATVSDDGVVTGVGQGTAEITATHEEREGAATISVVDFLPPTTGFEDRDGAGWTTHTEELDFLAELADASDRVTLSEIGETLQGRPIHLVRVGYPEPPSDQDIAEGDSILVIGTQHGNEPAGREMALQVARDLAFTDDPETLEQLGDTTVLFIPTANPDGREANSRTNSAGVDPNRDHLYFDTAEGRAVARTVLDFDPEIVVDAHERPGGSNPDMELLWPRNLNVDEDLRALNREMIEDYLFAGLQDAGFTTGLYGSPGGAGDEDERISRNAFGLRHMLGLLTETAGQDPPAYRVEAQVVTVETLLAFHRERFDDVTAETSQAPVRRAAHGEAQGVFYFGGADNWPPEDDDVVDPGPCGYLLNTHQAGQVDRQAELFGVTREQVSDRGVFVTMAQPMMTVVPLLLDARADFNLVEGDALDDCSDPGSLEPPEGPPDPTPPGQFSTDFADDEVGAAPEGWSTLWRDSAWTVLDDPTRLRHEVTAGGRRALTWDAVGDDGHVQGDVEIAGLVRTHDTGDTMLQIGFHYGGDAGSEDAYYLDARSPDASSQANHVRINRYLGGSYTGLGNTELPFTLEDDAWYWVVIQRDGDTLRVKLWPDGEDEPDWQASIVDRSLDGGRVGLSHFTAGSINDWAFVGVGTGGEPAPRAPNAHVS